ARTRGTTRPGSPPRATRVILLPTRKTPRATRMTLPAGTTRPRRGTPVIPRRALTWLPFRAAAADRPKGGATGAAGRPAGKKTTLLPIPSLMASLPQSRGRAGAGDNGPIGVDGQPRLDTPGAGSPLFAAGAGSAANGVQSITLSMPSTAS